ncbi:hypothetical protein Tco_1418442 [Tanacetum coccineum]
MLMVVAVRGVGDGCGSGGDVVLGGDDGGGCDGVGWCRGSNRSVEVAAVVVLVVVAAAAVVASGDVGSAKRWLAVTLYNKNSEALKKQTLAQKKQTTHYGNVYQGLGVDVRPRAAVQYCLHALPISPYETRVDVFKYSLGRATDLRAGSEDSLNAKHQQAVKGLAECKASASNLRQYADGLRRVRGGNTLMIIYPLKKNKLNLIIDNDGTKGSHVTNVSAFDIKDFSSWKDRFLVYLDGLEPYLIEILKNGPFVPMSPLFTFTNQLTKPQKQWSPKDEKLANQDKRLKSIIISCLPNDIMKFVIKCATAKAMWTGLVLAHEELSNTRDTKIAVVRLRFNAFKALEGEKVNRTFTRLKYLLNDLENNGVSISQAEVNVMFVNSLPRKWLSMNQTQRTNNSIKNDTLAALDGKYNYEEGLIDKIYDDSDVEEDTRSSSEILADLNAEFHDRALLANQKRFYKRSGRVGSAKKILDKTNETCLLVINYDYKGKYKGLKAEIAILTKRIDSLSKGKSEKGLVADSFDWDEESMSSIDEGVTKVKAFMAIVEEEPSVEKGNARSGQWVKITIKKIARLNLVNESLKDEISDLKKVIEKWTSSKVTLDQVLSEQVPGNIVYALGGRGKRKDNTSLKEEPLPPLLKLSEVVPNGTSPELISLADLTQSSCVFDKPKKVPDKENSLNKLVSRKPYQSSKLKAQSSKGSSSRKAPLIPKPFINCKYYSFNDHHSDECEYYPGCDIYGSIAHETADCTKKPASSKRKPKIASQRSNKPTENGCSRYMTGVKQYLHRYSNESSPKVVFRDNSSGDTEGYGSMNCNGINFTKVAYVNGLKHNLISINLLCDANFKVLFIKTQETIFNQNNKVVLIAPRRRDVYVIDMSSYNEESNACFFSKASNSVNWLWNKRLSPLNFKNINKLAR